jgi:hypothetical protein
VEGRHLDWHTGSYDTKHSKISEPPAMTAQRHKGHNDYATSHTFITAVVYGIESKSAIVKSASPRACMAASVFLISARRRD